MTFLTAPAEFTLTREISERTKGPIRWIWSHAVRYWPILTMLVIGAIGNAALAAVVPVLVGNAFNDMLKANPDVRILIPLALILGGSQIIRGVLQFGRNFGAELMAQKIERDIRDELYVSLLGKSMTFHNLQPVGDTMARSTNDVREVNFMFSPGINLVVGSSLFMIIPFFVVPRYSPALLLTPSVFAIAYFISLAQYLKTMSPVTDEVRGTFGDMNTHLSEALDGVEIMKGAAQEGAEVETFVTNARRVRNAFVHQGDIEARFLPNLLIGLAYAFGLFHALILFRAGVINTGGVVAYFGLLRMLEFPTFTSSFAYTQISSGISSARRILELINSETNLDQNASGRTQTIRGEIEFRGVSFAYPSGKSVLQDISFKIKPGQTVAIVGQTGAGKTSLVKLINRTYDATAGQILVDGIDVRDWNLASLRGQISMIEQDIFLFSRSVSDNISFGKPGATREIVESAAQAAQAHEFIQTFSNSYDTVIGERGVTLSGGQRQRLALARAFLTDPRLLILDDSTSAIDSATEDKIQRAIANAAKGRTTILITHRLSQIRWADLIIVLRGGKIAALGSHEELMKTSEAYSRIFRE
ncbi:MAG: ABC transporter ATP-binding protein [Chloroflexi bacterium]|nr:ABC transporter ATP-binding protein [Chloroflexota bacterium]MBI3340074.1 ABC transporter ATP-binding protein [Chloroflexota bacterium]